MGSGCAAGMDWRDAARGVLEGDLPFVGELPFDCVLLLELRRTKFLKRDDIWER